MERIPHVEQTFARRCRPRSAVDHRLPTSPELLTGDNGLGKSFVLDIAWWALTRTWSRGVMAAPRQDADESGIGYSYTGSTGEYQASACLTTKPSNGRSARGANPFQGW